MEDAMQDVLLSHDVGRLLDVSPAQVRQLARQGRLKPVAITPTGTRIFSRREVEAYAKRTAE